MLIINTDSTVDKAEQSMRMLYYHNESIYVVVITLLFVQEHQDKFTVSLRIPQVEMRIYF